MQPDTKVKISERCYNCQQKCVDVVWLANNHLNCWRICGFDFESVILTISSLDFPNVFSQVSPKICRVLAREGLGGVGDDPKALEEPENLP